MPSLTPLYAKHSWTSPMEASHISFPVVVKRMPENYRSFNRKCNNAMLWKGCATTVNSVTQLRINKRANLHHILNWW